MLTSKSELSELLDVSERTLSAWQQEGLPIEVQHQNGNTYDTAKVIEWIVQRESKCTVTADGQYLDLEQEKARLTKAQADSAELKLAELENSLIPAEEVEAEWADMIMSCRVKLLSMPSKLAPVITHETSMPVVESSIRDAIYEALNELSQQSKTEG